MSRCECTGGVFEGMGIGSLGGGRGVGGICFSLENISSSLYISEYLVYIQWRIIYISITWFSLNSFTYFVFLEDPA